MRSGAPNKGPKRGVGVIGLCVCAELVILSPVLIVVFESATGGWHAFHQAFSGGDLIGLVAHTLLVAGLATPLCAIVGTSCAWLVTRCQIPASKMWLVLCVMPLTIPAVIASYSWAAMSHATQGLLGAVLVTVLTYFPLVFLLVSAALRGLDPSFEDVSMSLGNSSVKTFFKITLPQLRPALVGSLLLVALDSLVEFDAFSALKYQTFTTDIYAQLQTSFSFVRASSLSLVSVVICIGVLYLEYVVRGGAQFTPLRWGARRVQRTIGLGRLKYVGLGFLMVVSGASVGVPLGSLAVWFIRSHHPIQLVTGQNAHYLLVSSLTSLGFGLGGAIFAVILAFPVVLYLKTRHNRLSVMFERGTYLAFALPDLVGALALSYGVSRWAGPLYQTIPVLIFAYAILFVPLAVVALKVVLEQVEPRIFDVAQSLEGSRWRTLLKIIVPLIWPGLAAGAVLIFAFTVGDLATTQVLIPPGMYTLETQFWSNANTVAFGAGAPYALVLLVLAGLCAYLLAGNFGKLTRRVEV